MKRLVNEFYKQNNDASSINIEVRSTKTPIEAFNDHNKLLLLENITFLGNDEEGLKAKLDISRNFFLHGNIALNNASNGALNGGNLTTHKLNLSPHDINKSRYNVLGIEEAVPTFREITLTSQLSKDATQMFLDINSGSDASNAFVNADIKSNTMKLEKGTMRDGSFTKITNGSATLENGLFTNVKNIDASTVEITESLTIGGNLTFKGVTLIDISNLEIGDNIIRLNSEAKSSNIPDSGIFMKQDTSSVYMGWQESNGVFVFGTTNSNFDDKPNITNITTGTIQADISGTVIQTEQLDITDIPFLSGVYELKTGSLDLGFGEININTNIITSGKIQAPTIDATMGISGEPLTLIQPGIKELPNLYNIGNLIDGSLNEGFGPIHLGNKYTSKSKISALTIEALEGLSGELLTMKQPHIEELPGLYKIGKLMEGSFIGGFGPIDLGADDTSENKISALTIGALGPIDEGIGGLIGGLSGELINLKHPKITELPALSKVGSLTKGSIVAGFGPIDLGTDLGTDLSKSKITSRQISTTHIELVEPFNRNLKAKQMEISDISCVSVKMGENGTFTMIDSEDPVTRKRIRVEGNVLQYQTGDSAWEDFTNTPSTSEIKDAIQILKGPSQPRNLQVKHPASESPVFLDISWNRPLYSKHLSDTISKTDDEFTYNIELSKNSKFDNIDVSMTVVSSNDTIIANLNNTPGSILNSYYVRVSAEYDDRVGRPAKYKVHTITT
jgi:hypothetical protein